MSTKPAPTTDAAVEPSAFPLTLDEFCAQLSGRDRRTELIGGFHHVEKAAGRVKDLASAYEGRFVEFANAPA